MAAIIESKDPAGLITSIFPVIIDGFGAAKIGKVSGLDLSRAEHGQLKRVAYRFNLKKEVKPTE